VASADSKTWGFEQVPALRFPRYRCVYHRVSGGKLLDVPRAHDRLVSLFMVFAVAACLVPFDAAATWSIVAVDPRTEEVGSAAATCTDYVERIVGVAPGHGVIVAQARSHRDARLHGVQMLLDGASPKTVLGTVANTEFDPHVLERQYGIVTLGFGAASAAFTGADTGKWSGHATSEGVAVQGNILPGPDVVHAAMTAFEESEAFWLGERLLRALEAGSVAGGDRRCGEQGALSAYLVVAQPGDPVDAPSLNLIVPEQPSGGPNPVPLLRKQFETWRETTQGDRAATDR
jgi:uncharacterized Ntn-hydrolase superfamily protein